MTRMISKDFGKDSKFLIRIRMTVHYQENSESFLVISTLFSVITGDIL